MTLQILPIIVIFLNITLAFFVLSQNSKAHSNQLFALLASLGAVWIFANFLEDILVSIFWLKTSYALGALVISVGLIWVLLITENKLERNKVYLISFIALSFSAASYLDGFIVNHHDQIYFGTTFTARPGWGLAVYALFYFGSTFLILFKLYYSKIKTKDAEKKIQFNLIFVGALITLIATACTSFVFPHYFSVFTLSSIDSIGFLIFLLFIAYSITRHHLFNIRVIAIELVTFGLWTIILIRTLLADTLQERLLEGGLLVLTVMFGIMLIKSTLHEIKQRERIEKLADDVQKAYAAVKDLNENLEAKVAEQTKEVKRAYEVEKRAHQELTKLDETKNQLITAAQHNLRTPLTALRWQLEEIRKNGGNEWLQEALKESEASVGKLTEVLEDFLKITEMRVL